VIRAVFAGRLLEGLGFTGWVFEGRRVVFFGCRGEIETLSQQISTKLLLSALYTRSGTFLSYPSLFWGGFCPHDV